MMPVTLAAAGAATATGGGTVVEPLLKLRSDTNDYVDMELAGGLADGGKIMGLIDVTGNDRNAVQASSSNRPLAEDDLLPGTFLALFDDLQNLQVASPGGNPVHVFMIVHVPATLAGTRVLYTRDTSATTTKPAQAIQLG